MGMQVRVTGSTVTMGESGADQALDVDLADPVGAGAAEQCVSLYEPECVRDRCLVGAFDGRRDWLVRQRPQGRHRLHR